MKYKTILADPPWNQSLTGKWSKRQNRAVSLPYPTMTLDEIKKLPIGDLAEEDCHLWLWTTNQFLDEGFDVMRSWGFKYLCPIVWVKPSGLGNYFIHRTQTILFGYKTKCIFPNSRYKPNIIFANAGKHSTKPEESYSLIESISSPNRLELFSRNKRSGWDSWGNEIENDIEISPAV